jgi:phosphatidylserine/phosphatidylglycerophosphate/cardiolipin synthase-like enzyme
MPATAIEALGRARVDAKLVKRHILAVRRVEKRRRMYLPAVALFFRSERGNEQQIAVAVNGQLSARHEAAIAAAPFVKRLTSGTEESADEVSAAVVGRAVVRDAHRVESFVRESQATLAQRADDEDDDVPQTAETTSLERRLEELPVRPLETFEHPRYLSRALDESVTRLLVISPWLRDAVIDRDFLSRLAELLERQVVVYIGWGIGKADDPIDERDRRPSESLAALARRFENLKFKRLGSTHAKVLISDERFLIVTSFNWLSYRGDPDRTVRDERGLVVTAPDLINRQFNAFSELFEERRLFDPV